MIQSCALHTSGAPGTEAAASGGGAPFVPAFHWMGWTVTSSAFASPSFTVISATPGITTGGRTMTRTGYGPALPS